MRKLSVLIKSNAAPYLKLKFVILAWNNLEKDASITIKESSDICKCC